MPRRTNPAHRKHHTGLGAINAALIVGNPPPEARVDRLRHLVANTIAAWSTTAKSQLAVGRDPTNAHARGGVDCAFRRHRSVVETPT